MPVSPRIAVHVGPHLGRTCFLGTGGRPPPPAADAFLLKAQPLHLLGSQRPGGSRLAHGGHHRPSG